MINSEPGISLTHPVSPPSPIAIKCESTWMPQVTVLVNGSWLLKVIFYAFHTSPNGAHSSSLSLYALRQWRTWKILPESHGKQTTLQQRCTTWSGLASSRPHVSWCVNMVLLNLRGNGNWHRSPRLKTLATVHAVATENVSHTRTQGLFHSTC